MASLIRELRSLVNPLRKSSTDDKTEGDGAVEGVRTRGAAASGSETSDAADAGGGVKTRGGGSTSKDVPQSKSSIGSLVNPLRKPVKAAVDKAKDAGGGAVEGVKTRGAAASGSETSDAGEGVKTRRSGSPGSGASDAGGGVKTRRSGSPGSEATASDAGGGVKTRRSGSPGSGVGDAGRVKTRGGGGKDGPQTQSPLRSLVNPLRKAASVDKAKGAGGGVKTRRSGSPESGSSETGGGIKTRGAGGKDVPPLRSLVNPLRKSATASADKAKAAEARAKTLRCGSPGSGSSEASGGARIRRGITSGSGTSGGDDKDDKMEVEDEVTIVSNEVKDAPQSKSSQRVSIPLLVPLLVLDKMDTKESTGEDSDATTRSQTNFPKCSCLCVKRLEALEGELNDLKHWKAGRKQMDDIISSWKEEVDKWMLSKFGFSVSISTAGSKGAEGKDGKERRLRPPEEGNRGELVTVLSPTSGTFVQEFIDEGSQGEEEDPISMDSPERIDDDPFKLNSKETEHVEITPDIDIFSHFMLENDQDDQGGPEEVMLVDDDDDDDDDDQDVAGPSVKTRLDRQIIKMREDDKYDSDSDSYSASTKRSSDSDLSSSDEDYSHRPESSTGRGRGRPMKLPSKTNSQAPSTSGKSHLIVTSKPLAMSGHSGLTPHTRKELLKQCKPKPGNLWECNVCGFMLSSLENMLLHVKYNHSTSTHTCPFCRVVVLCRSPKDAAEHQRCCKMRAPGTKVYTPKYSFTPTPSAKPEVPYKKSKVQVEDINAKVNKFIEDMLDPNSEATARILGKTINNSTKPPAVVTLSSDDDSD